LRIDRERGKALEQPTDNDLRFEPGEVHAEADVRPGSECGVVSRVAARDVELVGVREERGIAIHRSRHNDDWLARFNRYAR
jgi:hypothetical protein